MEDEKKYIGCDVHREYSVIRVMDERGTLGPSMRVKHSGGELERLLQSFPPGSPVAVETSGSAMWALGIVEAAGLEPHLAHALEVKKRIAGAFQTDESDAAGLAMLLRNGTLPEVWIASPNVRDLRGLVRSRLAIRRYQTAFKNRIHGVLNQYGLKNLVEEEEDIEVRDWFSVKAHAQLMRAIESLPSASREALRQEYILVRKGKAWSEAMYRTSGGFEAPLLPCGGRVSPAAGKPGACGARRVLKPLNSAVDNGHSHR